jgi:hypothetical protein
LKFNRVDGLRRAGGIFLRCANSDSFAAVAMVRNYFFAIFPSKTGGLMNPSALGIGFA